jgi:hypothetical protein
MQYRVVVGEIEIVMLHSCCILITELWPSLVELRRTFLEAPCKLKWRLEKHWCVCVCVRVCEWNSHFLS